MQRCRAAASARMRPRAGRRRVCVPLRIKSASDSDLSVPSPDVFCTFERRARRAPRGSESWRPLPGLAAFVRPSRTAAPRAPRPRPTRAGRHGPAGEHRWRRAAGPVAPIPTQEPRPAAASRPFMVCAWPPRPSAPPRLQGGAAAW